MLSCPDLSSNFSSLPSSSLCSTDNGISTDITSWHQETKFKTASASYSSVSSTTNEPPRKSINAPDSECFSTKLLNETIGSQFSSFDSDIVTNISDIVTNITRAKIIWI